MSDPGGFWGTAGHGVVHMRCRGSFALLNRASDAAQVPRNRSFSAPTRSAPLGPLALHESPAVVFDHGWSTRWEREPEG